MSISCSTSDRFTGTILELGDVEIDQAADTFDEVAALIVSRFYPGCKVAGVGTFYMEPGQEHPAHKDEQPPHWIARIHIPLSTNDGVVFTMDDGEHRMEIGKAYAMNTLATHAVVNRGETGRTHLVIDVRS